MSADSPRHSSRGSAVPATVLPQVVSDRSILDSALGFINDVTLAHQPLTDPKDTITWARFESMADISDPRYGEDWELEGNVAPPLLLILGYGLGVQVWAIPANGEAKEVLSWRHGVVSALRVLPTPAYSAPIEENGRADEPVDAFAEKRPLIALVDSSTSSGAPPQFSAVNFISLKTGLHVKTIKFKNTVLDILANRSSIVVTFNERIVVFDARTLEDRLSITTCYPSPGINPNPIALGPRWLAYAEQKLLTSKRSGGGCDGDGVASYTATVLNAAKSFGKGLRELGEQVAAGLTGATGSSSTSKNNSFDSSGSGDARQPGVVTIMDIKYPIGSNSPTSSTPTGHAGSDSIVAHFIAHSEAVVALEFDNSGMLLLTADRRGHDFHIFRVQPHPVGSSLAAVHHLYVLHRGDTTAKVQNVAFSLDSRWVAVSTLRGTTHVFPITPYGGPIGARTHTSLHVVNKLSRFHRSAGLSADGRSSSPISHSESTTFVQSLQPYHNPTLPPYPRPTVVLPLSQLRQPFTLGSPPGSAALGVGAKVVGVGGGSSAQRQRLSSLSDDNGKPLSVCAIFAKSRSMLLDPPNATHEVPYRMQRKAVDSLFVMAGHGALIQFDLDTKLASNVAKEKICDDTPIELEVEPKAHWNLGRRREGSHEIMPPLGSDNWLMRNRNSCMLTDSTRQYDDVEDRSESWLSKVEISTHAGPHRRLWMGPQFVFKTYNTPSGSNLNHVDAEAVEVGISNQAAAAAAATAATTATARSSPLNMPITAAGRSTVPVLIESGSYSSIEQSPKLVDRFRHEHLDSDYAATHGDTRLKEDLADAMRESPTVTAAHKDTGRLLSDAASSENIPFYDALAEHDHEHDDDDPKAVDSYAKSAAALASVVPNIHSFGSSSSGYESVDSLRKPKASIEKVVNPLGTVTTVTAGMSAEVKTDILDEVVSQLAAEECVIHENCDESLFRPVVAIFCDENMRKTAEKEEEARKDKGLCNPPELISNKLIVPVIAKEVDAELSKKEKQKSDGVKAKQQLQHQQQSEREEQQKFAEMSSLNRKIKDRSVSADVEVIKIQELRTTGTKTQKIVESKEDATVVELRQATTDKNVKPGVVKLENKQGKSIDLRPTRSPKVNRRVEITRKMVEENIAEDIKSAPELENVKKPAVLTKVPPQAVNITEVKKSVDKSEKTAETLKAQTRKTKSEEEPEAIQITIKQEEKETHPEIGISKIVNDKREAQQKSGNVKRKIEIVKERPKVAYSKAEDAKEIYEMITENIEVLEVPKAKPEIVTVIETPEVVQEKSGSLKGKAFIAKQSSKSDKTSPKKLTKKQTPPDSDEEKMLEFKRMTPLPAEKLKKQKAEVVLAKTQIAICESPTKTQECTIGIEKSKNTLTKNDAKVVTVVEKIKKPTEATNMSVLDPLTPLESVDIYNIPQSALKKLKQKSVSKSNSNSESEEIIDVTLTKPRKSLQSLEKELPRVDIEKKCSASSDDLADSLLEMKSKLEETMYISCSEKVERDDMIRKEPEIITKQITAIEKSENVGKNVKTTYMTVEKVKEKELLREETVIRPVLKFDALKEEHCSKLFSFGTDEHVAEKVDIPKDMLNKEYVCKVIDFPVLNQVSKTAEAVQVAKTTVKKEAVVMPEITQKSKDKEVEVVDKIDSKKGGKSAITSPKSPNKTGAESQPKATEITTPPVPMARFKDDSKKLTTKIEEIKVITEQPARTKENLTDKPNSASLTKKDQKLAAKVEMSTKSAKSTIDSKDVTDSVKSAVETKYVFCSPKKSPKFGKNVDILTSAPIPATSAWKTLSGAEMISKKLDNERQVASMTNINYPNLGAVSKNKKTPKSEPETKGTEKLLPDFPTPMRTLPDYGTTSTPIGKQNNVKKNKKLAPTGFENFCLEPLPPLPALEPLEIVSPGLKKKVSKNESDTLVEQLSLINFESPPKENPALERKITPPSHGFTEQNYIYSVCGSLHYEHEGTKSVEKVDSSPTLSLTRSSSVLGEQSTAEYKSLTENDEQYMSLDQSSQETNTTNTATTNEKLSSSPNSSASEEIIALEDKKLSKKQRRKRIQMELVKHEATTVASDEINADEELRPLIAMGDSQMEQLTDNTSANNNMTDNVMDVVFTLKPVMAPAPSSPLAHSTTTDSEGPMPATTSDDNVFKLPSLSAATSNVGNKQKTKKLEHKINLIAAIEAATSSSTSSAEESGLEVERTSDLDVSVLATTLPTPAQASAAKKKTKRRKR